MTDKNWNYIIVATLFTGDFSSKVCSLNYLAKVKLISMYDKGRNRAFILYMPPPPPFTPGLFRTHTFVNYTHS